MIRTADSHRHARRWVALGAAWAGIGVMLGAFGAHALESRLTEAGRLDEWHTAVQYQVWHALALVLLGTWHAHTGRRGNATALAFLAGSACFSGSLYALCLGTPAGYIWFVTPLGGLLLIVGWAMFAASALRANFLPRDAPPPV